ncbi:uncharacterized protein LOC110892024 [Helianthus annuus]|uniref:uncharacterized protein LOC110892024 n=1 Tax=Helianthus annuus TaxID=4232 RepID=UPI000B8F07C9|nr:uncharacterized protein LOC110892024 [Helianthus annuus]
MGARLGDDGNWIVDSGCTEYISYLLNLFHGNLKTTHELPVRIPNGDSIPVKRKGSSTLPNGTEIRDVLYVPDFTCNLLSVSRLTRDLHCTLTFFPNFFVMQDLNSKKLIEMGKCQHGLYRMKMAERERKAMSASVEYNETNEGEPLVNPHVNGNEENQNGENAHGHEDDVGTISHEVLVEASSNTSNINDHDLNNTHIAEHEMQNTVGPSEQNTSVREEENAQVRPSRVRTQPARFNDYNVKLPPSIDHTRPTANQSSSTLHPLACYISYDNFSPTHKAFLSTIDSCDEPKTFRQASLNHEWREAMKKEIKALEQNGTWTLETLPKNKSAIDSKWVYKIK